MKKISKYIRIYKKASPRTNRDYDQKMIKIQDLDFHLKRGWLDAKPGPEKVKPVPLSDITDEIKSGVLADIAARETQIKTANKYNITMHTLRKIINGEV